VPTIAEPLLSVNDIQTQAYSKQKLGASKTKLRVDPVLLSTRPRPALATLNPNILR
jgi:hypothetical protein